MVICLTGDEYLISKKIEEKRKAVGTEFCTFTSDASRVFGILSSPLIFSDQRAIIYKGSLESLDEPDFWSFINSKDPDTYLIILPTSLNTKLFKRFKEEGHVHDIKKISTATLKQTVLSKIKFDSDEALELYIFKASYGEKGGKTLYEIESEINILSSLDRTITVQDIDIFIDESTYNNVFNIVTLIETQNTNLLLHSIDKLLAVNNNVLNILGIIRWRYRLSYKKNILRASESEIGANSIKSYAKSDLKIKLTNRYSNFITTGRMSGAQALKLCALELVNLVKQGD